MLWYRDVNRESRVNCSRFPQSAHILVDLIRIHTVNHAFHMAYIAINIDKLMMKLILYVSITTTTLDELNTLKLSVKSKDM